MNILHVGAEFFPFVKTGGLGDVLGVLPLAQKKEYVQNDIRVLLPGYPQLIKEFLAQSQNLGSFQFGSEKFSLLRCEYKSIKLYLIDSKSLFERSGSPYQNEHKQDFADNHIRFAILGWTAANLAQGEGVCFDPEWQAEIVHSHDWHAGLTGVYMQSLNKTAHTVFTVHNLAHQGLFSNHYYQDLQLPHHYFNMNGLEFYGQISFIKAGLIYSDYVTTVSPTYSHEITTEKMGFGLHGLFQELKNKKKLFGILNGIDESIWNPTVDPLIHQNYNYDQLDLKKKNKWALQKECNLKVNENQILFVVVSRLVEQKGLDLVLSQVQTFLDHHAQLVILGSGENQLEKNFQRLSNQYPSSIFFRNDYDEDFSHRVIAGGDVILVPSRFEPCGLTQLYGLKYGTLPLVHETGGLIDTVTDCSLENQQSDIATGFTFQEPIAAEMQKALLRSFALWESKDSWEKTQRTAMKKNYSWEKSAEKFLVLYNNLVQNTTS